MGIRSRGRCTFQNPEIRDTADSMAADSARGTHHQLHFITSPSRPHPASPFGSTMSASGSASSSSSVSSAPAALASALASNGLCAPAALGDPFTALMIDAKRHFLVSGTATGRVSAWAIPHLTLARRAPRDLDDAQRAAVAEVRAAIAADQFPAAALAKGSDEGIRSIFTIGERVFALVGDVNAKTWSSYDAQGYQLIKYRRIHTANMCHLTFTLQHEANIVLLQRDAMNEGLLIDLQLGEQKAFPFVLGSRSTPVSFDGQRLVVVTNASTAVTGSGEPAPRLSQEVRRHSSAIADGDPKRRVVFFSRRAQCSFHICFTAQSRTFLFPLMARISRSCHSLQSLSLSLPLPWSFLSRARRSASSTSSRISN